MGKKIILLSSLVASILFIGCGSSDGFNGEQNLDKTINGKIIDGYIKGAEVFMDLNGNGVADPNEPITVTDENGNFVLKVKDPKEGTPIVATGGTDVTTGEAFKSILKKPYSADDAEGSFNVTPSTTLVTEMVVEHNITIANARSKVAIILDLSVADLKIDPMTNLRVFKQNLLLIKYIEVLIKDLQKAQDAKESNRVFTVVANEFKNHNQSIYYYNGNNTHIINEVNTKIVNIVKVPKAGEGYGEVDKIDPATIEKNTDAQIVNEIKNQFTMKNILKENASETNITTDLELLSIGAKYGIGITVKWTSSDTQIIKATGEVKRPAFGSGDKEVTLTAIFKKGEATETKEFVVTVKELSSTCEIDSLVLPTTVDSDLPLPIKDSCGSKIVWLSDKPTVISTEGKVKRPIYNQPNETVLLTAKVGENSKEFTITVLAQNMPDDVAVKLAKDELNPLEGKTIIEKDLNLPTEGSNQVAISWKSDNLAISSTGKVTKPKFGDPDVTVNLEATLTKGSVVETKKFSNLIVPAITITDKEIVAKAKETLKPVENGATVTTNLTLPKTGENGVVIKWTSDNEAITAEGNVTRPKIGDGNAIVNLTATLTKGDVVDTKKFEGLIVPEMIMSDAEAIDADKKALDEKYSAIFAKPIDNNVTLDTTGTNGSVIKWVSDNTTAMSNSGEITRAENDVTLKLTATVSKGSAEAKTSEFDVTVKKMAENLNQKDVDAVKTSLTFDKIKNGNTDQNAVTSDLTLSTEENGVQILWSSSDTNTISNTGVVNRPASFADDKTITLNATLSKGEGSDNATASIDAITIVVKKESGGKE